MKGYLKRFSIHFGPGWYILPLVLVGVAIWLLLLAMIMNMASQLAGIG